MWPLRWKLQFRADQFLRESCSTCFQGSIFHPRLEYSRYAWQLYLARCLQSPPQMLATLSVTVNTCIQTESSPFKQSASWRVKPIAVVAFVCFPAATHKPNVRVNEAHSLHGGWNTFSCWKPARGCPSCIFMYSIKREQVLWFHPSTPPRRRRRKC